MSCSTDSVAIRLWDAFKDRSKPVIGMLHVPALPGSPRNTLGFDAIVDWVLRDARALAGAGIDALILENFGDVPFYPHRVPAHTLSFMAVLAREVRAHRYRKSIGSDVKILADVDVKHSAPLAR